MRFSLQGSCSQMLWSKSPKKKTSPSDAQAQFLCAVVNDVVGRFCAVFLALVQSSGVKWSLKLHLGWMNHSEFQLLLAITILKHLENFSSLILLFVFLQDTQDGFKTRINGGKDTEPSSWWTSGPPLKYGMTPPIEQGISGTGWAEIQTHQCPIPSTAQLSQSKSSSSFIFFSLLCFPPLSGVSFGSCSSLSNLCLRPAISWVLKGQILGQRVNFGFLAHQKTPEISK